MEESLLSRRPAVRMVLLLAGGILAAESITVPLIAPLLLLLCSVLFAGVFCLRKRFEPFLSIALHAGVFFLGLSLQTREKINAVNSELIPEGGKENISCIGYVDLEPTKSGTRSQFILRSEEILRQQGWAELDRRILVRAKPEWTASLRAGMKVRIDGILELLPGPRNPGEFDPRRYFALQGINGLVVVEKGEGVSGFEEDRRPSIGSIMASVRRTLGGTIDALHGKTEANFLKGLLLAERGEIPFEIKQSFINTGTIHILAVSGLHVAVVAMVFYAFFGLLRMPKWFTAIATMIGLLAYMFLTGATASVVRSTIMACVILTAKLIQRRSDIYQVLAVSALIILLIDSKSDSMSERESTATPALPTSPSAIG